MEDYYPIGTRTQIDISQWLSDGFILKEKDFREHLKQHDWTKYQDHFAAIFCSTDAILPAWATVLVTIHLAPFAKKIVDGHLNLSTDFFEIIKNGFELNREISLLIKKLEKNEK